MQFIVTDLTRFRGPNVCLAGIDPSTFQCVRPLPYLNRTEIQTYNISPGSTLDLPLTAAINPAAPHTEDANRTATTIVNHGNVTVVDFRGVLEKTTWTDINSGFDYTVPATEKYATASPTISSRSIITIKLHPSNFTLVKDIYKAGEIKANLNDGVRSFSYIPITDLGFDNYVRPHSASPQIIQQLNTFIQAQEVVFLRVGLGRKHTSQQGKTGYWVQINGIYTFPNYPAFVRNYSSAPTS